MFNAIRWSLIPKSDSHFLYLQTHLLSFKNFSILNIFTNKVCIIVTYHNLIINFLLTVEHKWTPFCRLKSTVIVTKPVTT